MNNIFMLYRVQNVINMNKASTLIRTALRAYSRKNVGTRGKMIVLDENNDMNIEDFDFEDANEFESDFMSVHRSHRMHHKEVRQAKEMLKNKITQTKYFKESSPKFLTYTEKQQIQTLHNNDPEEWTIEKLSESFPALPEVIKKVLRSKWSPNSVESVIKHDTAVAENWEKFRAGKLALDPQLRTHLSKFKDRKILLANREELMEKLMPPKINLPKPKSRLFSSIVKSYVNESKNTQGIEGNSSHEPSLFSEPYSKLQIGTNEVTNKYVTKKPEPNKNIKKIKKKENLLMFNDFVKQRLEKLYEGSPEEAITLLDVYRKELEIEESKKAVIQKEIESKNESETSMEAFTTKESPSSKGNRDDPTDLFQEVVEKNCTQSVNTEVLQNVDSFNDRDIPNEKESLQVTIISNKDVPTNIINNDKNNNTKPYSEGKLQEENACSQLDDNFQNSGIVTDLRAEPKTAENKLQTMNTFKLANNLGIPKQQALVPHKEDVYMSTKKESGSNELDTHIKVWLKKSEDNVDYTLPIKIPKKIYEKGMTYRVKDCYYDDSGAFLYRVPGLRG